MDRTTIGDDLGMVWFDAVPDAIVGVAADGTITFANVVASETFGYPKGGLVGRSVDDLVPETSRGGHRARREAFGSNPTPRSMGPGLELFGRRDDGTTFPAEISLRPIRGPAGQVVIAAIRDVSVQRRDQARFRLLIEGAEDAVVGIDPSGQIVLFNAAAEDRFHRTRGDAVGQTFADLVGRSDQAAATDPGRVHPDDRAELVLAVEEVLAGTRPQVVLRYRLADVDGGWAVQEARGRAPADRARRSDSLLLISRDVSVQVRLEQAMRTAVANADRANRAKSEFLSGMSHELRTPLNALLGFAQLLDAELSGDDDRESVAQILRAGHHLLDLINEVLDIARIESGELTLSMRSVAVGEVVAELFDLLAPLASAGGVLLDAGSVPASDRVVAADPQRLRQVLLNLVSNAVKYNRSGGAVGVRCADGDDGMVRIEVRDTGWGIAPADRERLFRPFERLGAATSGVEGTGIGLALSRGLVEAMGGSIGIESELGVGSTFWVQLATAIGVPEPAAAPPAPVVPTPAPVLVRTVLCVDDNEANLLLLQRLVNRFPGALMVSATTGEEALALAADSLPSAVLLDLHLPDMSGEDVLRRLRADPATVALPIVVVSAQAGDGWMARSRGLGATACMSKPIDVVATLRLLGGWLGADAGSTGVGERPPGP